MPSIPLGKTLIYYVCGFAVESVVFGMYSVVALLSTRMLLKRGLKTKANKNLFAITLFMYILSTLFWLYGFVNTASRVTAFVDHPQDPAPRIPGTRFFVLSNAVILINFALSDALVIWRARLICASEHRKYMILPSCFVVLTSLSIAALISLRIAGLWSVSLTKHPAFVKVIDILQINGMFLSLLSNLTTTGVVGVTAWQHRETIRTGFKKTTQGNRILKLLLESGVVYCVMGVLGLVASLTRLPYNTLGDLFIPISVLLASAYTPTILLMVNSQRSLSEATFLGSIDLSDDCPPQTHATATSFIAGASSLPWLAVDHAEPKLALSQGELARDSDSVMSGTTILDEEERGHRHKISNATLV
ncbi:hypothetical protein MIND_00082600 [Mycena indigotica]|uniref:Uncharacterized protein n=1 Tax=Mycena indigotica TaxID=2126181 RepID=A0A8H6TH58_9AGAR|nr:uncharacterized protein MIND_00082600 [Mycena indigotica]KAF7315670.1 hypothetical protein MIND_00082600 [Mycena indigotica]